MMMGLLVFKAKCKEIFEKHYSRGRKQLYDDGIVGF